MYKRQLGRLFQPYFTTKKHGTGLGLFVTRKLVEDHGGTVECDSHPGRGTVFRVRLPIEAKTAVANGSPAVDEPAASVAAPPLSVAGGR